MYRTLQSKNEYGQCAITEAHEIKNVGCIVRTIIEFTKTSPYSITANTIFIPGVCITRKNNGYELEAISTVK